MKWKDLLERWNLSSLKLKTPFLEADWKPGDADKDAAWDLYIELLTRIATQPLAEESGIEKTALESIHSLFATTRAILKARGRECVEFTKLSIVVLNQIVRPFTAKWHRISMTSEFNSIDTRRQFRQELSELQGKLTIYCKALADIAGVEDLTDIN